MLAAATGLAVSRPSDPGERDADALASRAVGPTPARAHREADEADNDGPVTGKRRARVEESLAGGRPLPGETRGLFEQRLGADLGDVRVHDGPRASDAAQAVGARAFTMGRDLVFGAGEWAPTTSAGMRLLAHELAHAVLAPSGRASGGVPVIQREATPAHDLVKQFTSFGNLDEEGLGAELAHRAQQGAYDFVQNVLDDLGSSDRDDVALGFMQAASDALLDTLAANERGRLLLDRLYDELTEGYVAADEQAQANRILRVKSKRMAPGAFAAAATGGAAKVFPFRIPGPTVFTDAPITAERTGTGGVHVKLPVRVLGTDEFKQETQTLPEAVFTSGITIPADEVIGVRLYDLGGPVKFAPALFLVELSHQTDTKTLEKAAGVAAVALTLGTGALAGLGVEASVGARILLAADRAATVVATIGLFINDHRGWILSRFGARGAELLQAWDVLESITALYGFARVALAAPKVITAFRSALGRWRGAVSDAGTLGGDERALVNQMGGDSDKILNEADGIQAAAKPAGAPAPTGGETTPPAKVREPEQAPRPAEPPQAVVVKELIEPVNGRVNVGGGLEEGSEGATNLNPIKPGSGGPARGIPNHVKAGFEEIGEIFKPGSVKVIFSNRLRYVDVNWTRAANGSAKVMAKGGRLSLNVWANPDEAKLVVKAFTDAGFKDVRALGQGTGTLIMGTF